MFYASCPVVDICASVELASVEEYKVLFYAYILVRLRTGVLGFVFIHTLCC